MQDRIRKEKEVAVSQRPRVLRDAEPGTLVGSITVAS